MKQEIAIKDARFDRIPAKKRPAYTPSERFEILAIKSIRGWNNAQMAKRFQIAVQTIRRWFRGAENGTGIVQLPEIITRYPDYLRIIIRYFKSSCPMLGRHKIADILARLGGHISASTVRRIVQEPPPEPTVPEIPPEFIALKILTSKYPNHLWGGDITLVPTCEGLALGVELEAIPQEYPYCFHILNVVDHFSRRLMGAVSFEKCPTAKDITDAFDQIRRDNDASTDFLPHIGCQISTALAVCAGGIFRTILSFGCVVFSLATRQSISFHRFSSSIFRFRVSFSWF